VWSRCCACLLACLLLCSLEPQAGDGGSDSQRDGDGEGRARADSWLSWEDLPTDAEFIPTAQSMHDPPPKAPRLSRLRLAVVRMLSSGLFGAFITCLILVNTAVMALDHYPASEYVLVPPVMMLSPVPPVSPMGLYSFLPQCTVSLPPPSFVSLQLPLSACSWLVLACATARAFDARMEVINVVLSLLFALEMVLKLYGMRLKVYVRDPFNVFDFVIVIISFVEIGVAPPSFFGGDHSKRGAVSILRTLRLLRVLKLARSATLTCHLPACFVRRCLVGDVGKGRGGKRGTRAQGGYHSGGRTRRQSLHPTP
jgi:hypothetical protein